VVDIIKSCLYRYRGGIGFEEKKTSKKVSYFCDFCITFDYCVVDFDDCKKVSDKQVSEPKQEKTTETKKENKKKQTNLPKVKKIDQSGDPYENKVTVSDLDSIYILVNKYSGLPEDYEPSDLVQVPSSGENENVRMRKEAAEAFEKLIEAASNEGFILNACSAYRSYAYQTDLFNNGAASYGEEYADRYWTRPGFSEHQSGLAVDIRMDNDCSDLDAVRYNSHYNWLLENMHTYGFILRYPDDKEDKTKIAPESWHLRYVGVDLATYLYENNLTLDEYYGAINLDGVR